MKFVKPTKVASRAADELGLNQVKDLSSRFEGRILPVDFEIADTCGRLVARSESLGGAPSGGIAATAEVHGLTLVTRNASDFEATVKTIVIPWT